MASSQLSGLTVSKDLEKQLSWFLAKMTKIQTAVSKMNERIYSILNFFTF